MVSKKNIVLIAFSVLLSVPNITQAESAEEVCANSECTLPDCTCYCSVKCGPRPIEATDSPRYNKKHGKCFCADRDEELYEPNNCAAIDAQKEAE